MSYMFRVTVTYANSFNLDISNWNTKSLENVLGMFYWTGNASGYVFDLSKWNVNKATNYSSFNNGVESKVTSPIWKY